ncbi:MAG: hypothetical protein JW839_06380 [Candidatus Lokiarchaeota archaeon]|nr:hypothetical protein [Candidatus Lokiarchaeota archaeon]
MAERLLSKTRLERARAIPDHAVVEYAKVQDEPLVVYGRIQGSDSEPYTVIIDLEQKVVAHWCPDFEGGGAGSYRSYGGGYGGGYSHGWCKHLGKILLMLEGADANKIVPVASSLAKVVSRKEIKDRLEKLKEKRVTAMPPSAADQPEVPLMDQVSVACQQAIDAKECTALFEAVNKRIEADYSRMDASLAIFALNSLLENIPGKFKEVFASRARATIDRLLASAVERFFGTFWIASTIKRLESASTIRKVAGYSSSTITLPPGLSAPPGATAGELHDARVVLGMLFEGNPTQLKRVLSSCALPVDADRGRLVRISRDINLGGTLVADVKTWIESQLSGSSYTLPSFSFVDDLFIYLLNVASERPTFTPAGGGGWGGRGDYYFLPKRVIEDNPATSFVMERVKETAREYITGKELASHHKIFTWLSGRDVLANWAERMRIREPDAMLTQGIIVQFDVNGSRPHQELLQAFDGSTRLVLDQSAPMVFKIQPFDFVLCRREMIDRPDYSRVVSPVAVLVPDQVVSLVMQGTPIVSNVLPWNVLSAFALRGVLSGAEVSIGIEACKKHHFIYGSMDLRHALEQLSHMGKSGMQDDFYRSLRQKVSVHGGRLNSTTREAGRSLLAAEGPVLDHILDLVKLDDDGKIKRVVRYLATWPDADAFRKGLLDDVLDAVMKVAPIPKDLFTWLKTEKLGQYGFAPAALMSKLKGELRKLKKVVAASKARGTREQVYKNKLGQLLAASISIPTSGPLTPQEREALKIKVDGLEAQFPTGAAGAPLG